MSMLLSSTSITYGCIPASSPSQTPAPKHHQPVYTHSCCLNVSTTFDRHDYRIHRLKSRLSKREDSRIDATPFSPKSPGSHQPATLPRVLLVFLLSSQRSWFFPFLGNFFHKNHQPNYNDIKTSGTPSQNISHKVYAHDLSPNQATCYFDAREDMIDTFIRNNPILKRYPAKCMTTSIGSDTSASW